MTVEASSSIQFFVYDKLPTKTHHDELTGAVFVKIGDHNTAVTLGGGHPAAIAETLTGALKLLAGSDGITDEQRDEVRAAIEDLHDAAVASVLGDQLEGSIDAYTQASKGVAS